MSVKAKIVAYNYKESDSDGCSDFSLNMFWGSDYKNVFYLCGDLGRSTFEDIIETETDITGQTERVQNTSIERFNLTAVISTPLLQFLKTIDKHDVKELHFLDTGDVYTIKNIDIDDEGDRSTPSNLVVITFEDEAITKVSDSVITLDDAKQAFWDNDNNGVKDLDGEAQAEPIPFGVLFNTWQLYYESDGITPATSGDILMLVYATSQSGIESLVGIFRGEFGDAFTDSTKWQSTQQIWDYFAIGNTVGHTNKVQFDKKAFAEDNGYFSDELEDRAVDVRFDLSIDGSIQESTTLSLVYTVWGAFHRATNYGATDGNYGYITLGKVNQKNTLNTVIDTRIAQPAGTATTFTSAALSDTTNFSNEYVIDATPGGENSYAGLFTTPQGYVGENYRGTNGFGNYVLAPMGNAVISQPLNILNFTLGGDPRDFVFIWEYKKTGLAYATLGDPLPANAQILLDGVQIADISGLVGILTTSAVAVQGVSLPDTGVHTVTLEVDTSAGFRIFTSFEVQIKPLF